MFGQNEIVGKKFFKSAAKDTLMVTSMFFTLQGEGPFSGMPALFIRLAKCNLNCHFCFPSHYRIKDVKGAFERLDDVVIGEVVHSLNSDGNLEPTSVVEKIDRWVPVEDMVVVHHILYGWPRAWPMISAVTKDHLFEVVDHGYVKASDIIPGMRISSENKETRKVLLVTPFSSENLVEAFSVNETYHDGMVKVTTLKCSPNNSYLVDGLHSHNCDTFFDNGDVLTFEDIETRMKQCIKDYWLNQNYAPPEWAYSTMMQDHPGVTLVITGGEPLLQNNLTAFLETQVRKFRHVQIESNGLLDTKVPDGVTLVCSPKCLEKDGKAVRYLEPSKTILERADCLKFVMSADQASPYSRIPDWAFTWRRAHPKSEIYVSPMNMYLTMPKKAKELRASRQGEITMSERSTVDEVVSFWEEGLFDMKQNQKNHEYAARYCMQYGLRFNLQVHLFASLA